MGRRVRDSEAERVHLVYARTMHAKAAIPVVTMIDHGMPSRDVSAPYTRSTMSD